MSAPPSKPTISAGPCGTTAVASAWSGSRTANPPKSTTKSRKPWALRKNEVRCRRETTERKGQMATPDPNLILASVFESDDPVALSVAQARLADAGVEFVVVE